MPMMTPPLAATALAPNGLGAPNGVSGEGEADSNGSSLDKAEGPSVEQIIEQPRYTTTSYPSNCLKFLEDVTLPPSAKELVVKQAKVKLDIFIVGAGLGGLATAVALRRRGHDVTVFEQAPELMEASLSSSTTNFSSLKRH